MSESIKNIIVKEFEASRFITVESQDIIQTMQETFLDIWKEIFIITAVRFFYVSPLKNIQDYYHSSHLSDIMPEARVSPKTIGRILHTIGILKNLIKTFLSKYISPYGEL